MAYNKLSTYIHRTALNNFPETDGEQKQLYSYRLIIKKLLYGSI